MDVKYNILTVWVPVFYANDGISFLNLRFENDVKMYGTQTNEELFTYYFQFENDVKMYGTQTPLFEEAVAEQVWEWCKNVWYSNLRHNDSGVRLFENDVKMYGTQTWCYQTHTVYQFENDVKMYGTQTAGMPEFQSSRLRMM